MESVGIRELRQHASRWVQRVAQGERLQITDRGRAVAMLVPIEHDNWGDLLAQGRVSAGAGDLLDEPAGDFAVEASAALEDLRREER